MHLHFLDPYRPRRSPIHQLDPRVKLVLVLAFILTTALAPMGAWPVYILLLALILAVVLLSELGVSYVLKRAALAAPFVLAAAPLLFTTAGQPLVALPMGLTITLEGLERVASIAIKAWISVLAAIVLAASTSFPDLLVAMRAIRLPRLLVALFGLMWRYLFVLADEALRLLRARTARSGISDQPGLRSGGSVIWRGRVAGGLAGNLFLRGFERSDRIYMAMVSRGYDGEVRSLPLPAIQRWHWLVLAIGLGFLALLLAAAFFLGM
jgi:cobalt/nickel transport system permease protein